MQSVLNYNITKNDIKKDLPPEQWKPKAKTALSMQMVINSKLGQPLQNPMQPGQTTPRQVTSDGFGRSV